MCDQKIAPMNDYDPFDVGDRVWSLAYGFATIDRRDRSDDTVLMGDEIGLWISADGKMCEHRHRPRSIFHAVADTDEEMIAATAQGLGRMRPKPRSRFDFRKGDDVIFFRQGKFFVGKIISTETGSNAYPIKVSLDCGYESATSNGKEYDYCKVPSVVRLVDNEEIEKAKNMSPLEAMCFIAHKAIEEDWKP